MKMEECRILLVVVCLMLLLDEIVNIRLALKANMDGPFVDETGEIFTDRCMLVASCGKRERMDRATVLHKNPQQHNKSQERIALVMRVVDPIQPCLLKRTLHIAKTLQNEDRYKNYDFHLLVDQSLNNVTNATTLEEFFNEHNENSLEVSSIFGISENLIRQEFPELSNGYMKRPLVDGTYAIHPARAFMWQLMTPAIAVFSRAHQEYDYTWVFEDDVWSLGKPLVELFHTWDEEMRKKEKQTDLAVFRNRRNGVPYNKKMQGKHTVGFNRILRKMKVTPEQRKSWTKLLAKENQTWSRIWTEWNETHIPRWRCVSDTFYRHSRAYSNYLHKYLSKNVYQFAECFQQPMAWKGNFKITDLEYLLEDLKIRWEHGIVNKITRHEAVRRHKHWEKEQVAVFLYHGQSFYRKRHHGENLPPDAICREDEFGLT